MSVKAALARLKDGARLFLDPQTRRRDPEREMAVNRICISTMTMCGAAAVKWTSGVFDLRVAFALYLAYCAGAICVLVAIVVWPSAATLRRLMSMAMDLGAATAVCARFGPSGIGLLYPCYLLIIYGYGFRYGPRWLILSSIGAFLSLGAVGALSPAWSAHQPMVVGLLIGLVIIPAYAFHLVASLMRAKTRAEASDRAKSLFVAAVSHDLRTPLNAIIGLGDMLARSRLHAEESEMARMISQAGHALLGQIDTILDLTRLEADRGALAPEPVDLAALLGETRDLLAVSASAKGVALNLVVEGPPPRWLSVSGRALRDSLSNLVGNAIKFTKAGKVDIIVRQVWANAWAARIRFEVVDTGIGVSPLAQAQIFERFTQADETIRDNYGGSGLGLSIVRQLVVALGGELGVTSVEGAGSTFWFEIEAAILQDQAALEPARALAGPPIDRPADEGGGRVVALTADARLIELLRVIAPGAEIVDAPETIRRICEEAAAPITILLDEKTACAGQWIGDLEKYLAGARRGTRHGLVRLRAQGAASALPQADYGTLDVFDRTDVEGLAAALGDALAFMESAGWAPSEEIIPSLDARAILVVEDNRTNQKVIEKMLTRAGQRVAFADNGAIALMRLEKETFDVILMDVNMPVLGGVETARRARAMNPPVTAPIIALTADVTPETRALCAAAGMNDCATKPIDAATLLRMIEVHAPTPSAGQLSEPEAIGREGAPAQATVDFNSVALEDLRALGGADFVSDLARQFSSDAADLLANLREAVAHRDLARFHDEAHALRSCSANVGAQRLFAMCLAWRRLAPHEFAAHGAEYVAELEEAFARARAQIDHYIDQTVKAA